MIRSAMLAFVLVLFVVDAVFGSGFEQPEVLYSRCAPSVIELTVKTRGGMRIGTGFIVRSGVLATAWHVVQGATSVMGLAPGPPQSRSASAGLLAKSEQEDVALIEMKIDAPPLPLRTDEPNPGERMYCIGSPYETANRVPWSGTIVEGLASLARNFTGPGGAHRVIGVSCPVGPGFSGGPLLDASGRVAGVVEGAWGPGVSYAVPSSALAALKPGEVQPWDGTQ
jgi:S1-C subfamily serine protease